MNWPAQPNQPPAGYPNQPQQGYTQAPQGYYPQQPQQQAPVNWQQPYDPNFAQPQAAPAPVTARGSLSDFMDQPTGGGPAVTKYFTDQRPQGSWLTLQISHDVTDADVLPQTDSNGNQQFFMLNGRPDPKRPKWVLVLKCNVLQSDSGQHAGVFTEGDASVWIKGVTKDAFVAAMAQAGVPDANNALLHGKLGGAIFTMQSAGTRKNNRPGQNDTKLFNFQYKPNGREHLYKQQEAAQQPDPTVAVASPSTPVQYAPQQTAPVQQPQQPVPDPAQFAPQMAQPAPVSAPPTVAGYQPQQIPPGQGMAPTQTVQQPQFVQQQVPPGPGGVVPDPAAQQFAQQPQQVPGPPQLSGEMAQLLNQLSGGQG